MDSRTPELIVIHVPKTAGISFLHTLQGVYGEENCKQVWDLFPYKLHHHGDYAHIIDSPFYQDRLKFRQLADEIFSQYISAKVIHGHMPLWMYDSYFPDVPRVVWLRNPVDQVLSRIFHFRKHKILDAHLVSPREMLDHPLFMNNQFWYTGGMLQQFAFVGIVERYERCMDVLARQIGWGDVPSYHYHPTGFEDELRAECKSDPSFVAHLKRVNVHDFALYDYAAAQWI